MNPDDELADKILESQPDRIAFYASSVEQFYFIIDCQRAIRNLRERLSAAHSTDNPED